MSPRVAASRWLQPLIALLLLLLTVSAHAPPAQSQGTPPQAQVSAVRIWPGPDSTRITVESSRPIEHRLFTLRDPDRLVLELDGIDISSALGKVGGLIAADDPLIRQARVGRFKPTVVRLVFDLRMEVEAQAFALKPIGEFGHRIVLDLFPMNARDPVAAFLQRQGAISQADASAADAAAGTPATPGTPASTDSTDAAASSVRGKGTPGAYASQGPSPSARAKPGVRPLVIAIDPGHGGEDPGAIGPSGLREKDVVLSIGRRLARLTDAQPGLRAHLIRDGDYFVALHTRVTKARALNADLFVSIHADAWLQPSARGASVYALSLSGASSAAARWLASRENAADLIGGVNMNVSDPILKQTLLDLSQTATINDSLRLGRTVLSELGRVNRLHKKQVEQAGFAVLKAPDIPSILVETAFISNPQEEQRLANTHEQERIAQAILDGILHYIERTPGISRQR